MSTVPAPTNPPAASGAPTFVGCGARSGSTLLRFLLDAHPELSCPGETDLAVLVNAYVQIARSLSEGDAANDGANDRARAVAEELMGHHLERVGKSRWCDKSLSNVFHLDLLAQVWPNARFVLLHRHCMDFIMNGLEVSPWGLAEYGFAQVAQRSPTDSVVALAAYWVDRTSRLLAFEQQTPGRCIRIRYEDLVDEPEGVLGSLWHFLEAAEIDGISATAFAEEHSTFGAADHEIWYTNGIGRDSVGPGARVPPDHVAGPLRASVNDLLRRLDYPVIDDAWGSGGELPGIAPTTPRSPVVEVRVVRGHTVLVRAAADLANATLARGSPDGTSGFIVAVERDALPGLASGEENIGRALRSRAVRPYGPLPPAFRDEHEIFERLARTLAASGDELLGRSRPAG